MEQGTAARNQPRGTGRRRREFSAEYQPSFWKRLLGIVGPGVITGASDDDPSGIATYAVAGASFGFATLWTALISFPMMAVIQFICAKIGLVTGMGLAGVLRKHYSRALVIPVVFALLIANTINAGADLGAIASAVAMLVPIRASLLILPITLLLIAAQVWCSYELLAKLFKWLCLALFAYIGAALFAHPNVAQVLRGTLVPTLRFDPKFLATMVALLGTTISPYLFFWQSDLEVEEEKRIGRTRLWQRRGASTGELTYAALDVNMGMLFSNVVMYFIILATGATLFQAGKTNIQSATDAAEALRPLAGNASTVLLAIGLVGAGFLAVPVLVASSAYAVSEVFGWRYGLDERPTRARQFYVMIAVCTLIGMMINFVGINPISALFWTAVINGVLAPPLLVLIMVVSNNHEIMGARRNGAWTNVVGWATTAVMFAAAIALFATWGKA